MAKYLADTIEYFFPQATSQRQFTASVEDFKNIGENLNTIVTDSGNLAYDAAMAGGKILLLGVVAPSSTITGLQSLQQGLAIATYATSSYPTVYSTVTHASMNLATGLTFIAINPFLPPAAGLAAGTIASYQELLDAGYRIVHIPWEALKGTRNAVTGLNKCVIGSLLTLKDYLDPPVLQREGINLGEEEQEILTFEMEDFEKVEEEKETFTMSFRESSLIIQPGLVTEINTTGENMLYSADFTPSHL